MRPSIEKKAEHAKNEPARSHRDSQLILLPQGVPWGCGLPRRGWNQENVRQRLLRRESRRL